MEVAMGASTQPSSFLENGQSLIAKGDYVKAIPLLLGAASQDPNHFQTRFLLGICYLRTNDLVAAEQCFRKAVALDNGSHDGHYYLGLALERQGKNRDAHIEYRFALAIKPDFPEAAERIGANLRPGETKGPSPAKPDSPGDSGAAGSLAERIAARKGHPVDGSAEAMAGKEEITGYRRMRSFSGHFILTFAAVVVWILAVLFNKHDRELVAWMTLAPLFLVLTLFWRHRAHHYTIFERRIDIMSGLLFRKTTSVWLYQIEETWITRSPLNLVTGDSTLHVRAVVAPGLRPMLNKVTGLGNYRRMEELWMHLRDRSVVERREMKSVWI
jgi:tetratricopeptide (TPR) repeat protein